ncbi:MAG: alpha/beta hydrolase-fold protein [Methylotenera sp.]|nr:alpha/beta hydrolase-fold protein [Methylotenera sp.]
MNYQPPLELVCGGTESNSKIDASIIWLHGLGADGYDFEPIVQKLNLPNMRFILPHAPDMAVSRNNGYIMPAWYNLYGAPNSKTGNSKEDEDGITNSQNYVNSLIQNELNRGISAERIVIAGFSQGGAIALHTALRYPKKLGGILALSTYLPVKTKLASEMHPANAGIPIFMAHGVFDDVISLDMCKISLEILQSNHYSVSWHEYNMAHSVCVEEIGDIREFLKQVLP